MKNKYTAKELAACLGMRCKIQNGSNQSTHDIVRDVDVTGESMFEIIGIPHYDEVRHLKLTKIVMDLDDEE